MFVDVFANPLRHGAKGGELAADHVDQAVCRDDGRLARFVGRAACARGNDRAHPGETRQGVARLDAEAREITLQGRDQVVGLGRIHARRFQRAVVVEVSGTEQGGPAPRHREHGAPVRRVRERDGAGHRQYMKWKDEMRAAQRAQLRTVFRPGPQLRAPCAGRVHHTTGRHAKALAGHGIIDQGAGHAAVAPDEFPGAYIIRRPCTVAGSRGEHAHDQTGVVGHGIVVYEAAAQPVRGEVRHMAEERRAPQVVRIAPPRQKIVGGQPRSQLGTPGRRPAIDRKHERQRRNQIGEIVHEPVARAHRLAGQAPVACQITQPAVHEFRRPARCAGSEIALLDQCDRQTGIRGLERHAGAGDATADHQYIHAARARLAERGAPAFRPHGRAPAATCAGSSSGPGPRRRARS